MAEEAGEEYTFELNIENYVENLIGHSKLQQNWDW